MADKSVENMTGDEKIAHAKDLYQRGSRCYLVRDYADAADFLSEACALYAEVYGYDSDELGLPQLLYAKSLIALAQEGEHKILEVNDAQDSDDDDGETAATAAAADNDSTAKVNEGASTSSGGGPSKSTAASGSGSGSGSSNVVDKKKDADSEDDDDDEENEKGGDGGDDDEEDQEDNDSNTPTENLQIAWEILELVVKIFERQPTSNASNLSEAYFGLAEISLENSHFDTALRDYNRSLEILMKLPDDNLRLIAEIQYKIGLCHLSISAFDESIAAFEKARDVLDAEVENQQAKLKEGAASATEKINATIEDLKELKLEIVAKITDVQESIQDVKKELAAQLMGGGSRAAAATSTSSTSKQNGSASGNDGASSSKSTETPKPTDISHLIKRKKPDTNAGSSSSSSTTAGNSDGSPAKKVAH